MVPEDIYQYKWSLFLFYFIQIVNMNALGAWYTHPIQIQNIVPGFNFAYSFGYLQTISNIHDVFIKLYA